MRFIPDADYQKKGQLKGLEKLLIKPFAARDLFLTLITKKQVN
jgi:hypothetical protein